MSMWLCLSTAIIAFDQLTKIWVTSVLSFGESVKVTSFFDLVFVLNSGAAFSFLSSASGWQRWFFIILALGISAWIVMMLRQHAGDRLLALALALVLGGALGNVIDRFVYGAVVDFLYFHIASYYWPAFNVADSCICVGVALMLWHQFTLKESQEESKSP